MSVNKKITVGGVAKKKLKAIAEACVLMLLLKIPFIKTLIT
jgi:hypothetical protein